MSALENLVLAGKGLNAFSVLFLLFLNFSELFELTLTDLQLAPPSGESCFSMNNYLFIENFLTYFITNSLTILQNSSRVYMPTLVGQ
jgi:hypothetical protein